MSDMFSTMIPAVIRFTSRPGTWLVKAAGLAAGVFALLALLAVLTQGTVLSWVLLVGAAILLASVGVFAWRRSRLERQVSAAESATYVTGSAVGAPAMPSSTLDVDLATLREAQAEAHVRSARYLPRVEAAQRAMVRAAGGTVNAPYLADDFRITLVALIGTLATLPLAALGSFLALLTLLG